MARNYYSVKDVVADEFGDLVFAKNDAVASRLFANILKSHSEINSEDLVLFCIGSFDDVSGAFIPCLREVVIGDDTSDVDSLN